MKNAATMPGNDVLGCEIADAMRDQFCRYVALHPQLGDAEADTLTLWTLHTWAFGAAEATPYILVLAPAPETGKSRVLEVAEVLADTPKFVVDPSGPALFRLIETMKH